MKPVILLVSALMLAGWTADLRALPHFPDQSASAPPPVEEQPTPPESDGLTPPDYTDQGGRRPGGLLGRPPSLTERAPEQLAGVGLDQKPGQQVPLDAAFEDESGRQVLLRQYIDGNKPVVLNLMYHRCPTLCGLIAQGLLSAMSELAYTPGNEFTLITISIDPGDTPAIAAQKKAVALRDLDRPGAENGWHFLTGRRSQIQRVTQAVGFNYAWDDNRQLFDHPAVLVILTPDGRVARYLTGVKPKPFDVRAGLLDASEGRISTGVVDWFIHYCYTYDPAAGSYALAAMNVMRLGAAVSVAVIFSVLGTLWVRDYQRTRAQLAVRPPTA